MGNPDARRQGTRKPDKPAQVKAKSVGDNRVSFLFLLSILVDQVHLSELVNHVRVTDVQETRKRSSRMHPRVDPRWKFPVLRWKPDLAARNVADVDEHLSPLSKRAPRPGCGLIEPQLDLARPVVMMRDEPDGALEVDSDRPEAFPASVELPSVLPCVRQSIDAHELRHVELLASE